MDRIDICVEAPKIEVSDLRKNTTNIESSVEIRKRVERAVAIQKERYKGTSYKFNSQVKSKDINKYFNIDKDAVAYLDTVFEKLGLSARAYYKIIRVARTIADLDNSDTVNTTHISEAACYRSIEK